MGVSQYPAVVVDNIPRLLAYAEKLTDQTGTTEADITGLSVTVSVLVGRRIRVSAYGVMTTGANYTGVGLRIKEGNTLLAQSSTPTETAAEPVTIAPSVVLSPSAGTHTYKITGFTHLNGTWNLKGTTTPSYILVEDITGVEVPAIPTSVPVGVLARAEYSAATTTALATGLADMPGLSANVVVPAGRLLRISTFACMASGTAGHNELRLYGDGAQLNRSYYGNMVAAQIVTHAFSVVESPSAGTHTYKAMSSLPGTGTLYADGTNEAYIMVEDITPTPALASSAVSSTLAYSEVTANQAGLVGMVDLVGLTATVIVPAGRLIKITGYVPQFNRTAGTATWTALYIFEGTTQLAYQTEKTVNDWTGATVQRILSPTAGTHTYKLRFNGDGTQELRAATDGPAFILVEDITGASVPVPGAQLIGAVLTYAGSTAPLGWLVCDGASLSTTVYPDLFTVIGYTYGGSGASFNLPNLKGRVPVGRDAADIDWDVLGETRGTKTHTLTTAELASHNHTQVDHNHRYGNAWVDDAPDGSAGNRFHVASGVWSDQGFATVTANGGPPVINPTGSGTAHNNIQPSIVLNYIIRALP